MRALFLSACLLGMAAAQTPPAQAPPTTFPSLPDETVIVTCPDNTSLTFAEFRDTYRSLPEEMQKLALQKREVFLDQYCLLRALMHVAEQKKLDQESPFKEALMVSRLITLGQAAMVDANRSVQIENKAVEKRYETDREKYREVKVKAIRIPFKPTEEQAKAKAAKLVADLRKGADFAKLARENSDEEVSRAKDGDFGSIGAKDGSEAVRKAVFALKVGDVTDPIREATGFYIFRAEEISYRPMKEVWNEVYGEMQMEQYRAWMDRMTQESKAKNVNPAFLGKSTGPDKSHP